MAIESSHMTDEVTDDLLNVAITNGEAAVKPHAMTDDL